MERIVECVPNISEGRRKDVIEAVVNEIRSTPNVMLLDYSSDESHNRSVITFMGEPAAVVDAAVKLAKKAAELIDLTKHTGEHPRMGAVDVIPLIPIRGITKEETVELSKSWASAFALRRTFPFSFMRTAPPHPTAPTLPQYARASLRAWRKRCSRTNGRRTSAAGASTPRRAL